MTASTVHTHHALRPAHPVREHAVDTTVWVMAWTEVSCGWLHRRVVTPAWGWLVEHLYGLVITVVALTFVSGWVLTLHLSGEDAWSILVALVGYPWSRTNVPRAARCTSGWTATSSC
jgi:hypothetical protein